MIEDQQWVDVGEKAMWWGGTPNQTTCQTRPQAKPTRIDGILASREVVAWISGFDVEQEDMIPTPKILKLNLEGKAAVENNTVAKTISCLQDLFLEMTRALTEGKDDKEQRDISKQETKGLKESIR